MSPAGKKLQPESDPAPTDDDYRLIDFGRGRRLERFGEVWIDRPSPPAELTAEHSGDWPSDRWCYHRQTAQQGFWSPGPHRRAAGDPTASTGSPLVDAGWSTRVGSLQFVLKLTPSGQVGVFPEQRPSWKWIAERLAEPADHGLRVLNLFAYTGGSTLAAAAAGAMVTHVDAAEPAVRWARQNALANGLDQHPIRWIVDDARKFVAREIRRGQRYDGLILDPPSYGHGPKGGDWRFERDLPPLLELCSELLVARPRLILLTCHPSHASPASLRNELSDSLARWPIDWSAGELTLTDGSGRQLPSGFYVRGGCP